MFTRYEGNMEEPNATTTKILNVNRKDFVIAVRSCDVRPLIFEDLLTPEVYIDYARTLRKVRKPNKMLSKPGYGVKRAALYHFFPCHNGNGYPYLYCKKLTNLFKGFNRVIVTRKRNQAVVAANVAIEGQDPNATTMNHPQPLNVSGFSKYVFFCFF
jgi:hypothetical protein